MKKVFVTYLVIVGAAVATGVGTGALIKRVFAEPVRDYSGFDPANYVIDGDAIIRKVESYGSTEAAFNSVSEVESVLYAMEKYKRYENSYAYCKGLASTIVSQEIRSCQIKNGNVYFEESVSKSSMVGVAIRSIQKGKGENVDLYSASSGGVVIDSSVSSYGKEPHSYTAEEYIGLYGRTPYDMFNYIIHNETVKESSSKKLENDEGYEVTLVMDPDLSTYGYQFQMQTISNLDKKPVFSSVKLIYTLTKGLQLKKVVVQETYKVSMGIEVTVSGNLENYYFPNTFYKIPEIDENFDYLQKGEH